MGALFVSRGETADGLGFVDAVEAASGPGLRSRRPHHRRGGRSPDHRAGSTSRVPCATRPSSGLTSPGARCRRPRSSRPWRPPSGGRSRPPSPSGPRRRPLPPPRRSAASVPYSARHTGPGPRRGHCARGDPRPTGVAPGRAVEAVQRGILRGEPPGQHVGGGGVRAAEGGGLRQGRATDRGGDGGRRRGGHPPSRRL